MTVRETGQVQLSPQQFFFLFLESEQGILQQSLAHLEGAFAVSFLGL